MSGIRIRRLGWFGLFSLFLTVLVVYRGPLLQWFFIESEEVATPPSHHHHAHREHSAADESAPQRVFSHRFSEEHLPALRGGFAATEEIRIALSQDRVDVIPAAVTRVQAGLAVLDGVTLPEPVRATLRAAAASAKNLESADSAVSARRPYAALSRALFGLAEADPRLQEGWHAFSCPMAGDFPKWFQGHQEIENPYMGQQMLACGSASDWASQMEPTAPQPGADEVAHYTCPMHPSVRQQTPGTCPICNMDLTPVTHEDLRTGDVLVDSVRRQRIGVRTTAVARRTLVRPIRAVGEVAWDESRVHDVTARVDGWVEDLRVTRAGDPVERNATLLRFYSPDLLATQRELLAAPPGGRLATAARERLRLWGMSSWAIRDMQRRQEPRQRIGIQSPITGVVIDKRVNEGAHVSAGALLYRIADPSRVWVLADVFEQDLPHVTVGQRVVVNVSGATGEPIGGVVDYIYPTVSAQTRTARVRVQLDNPEGRLRPGMIANLSFDVDLGEHLAVPTDAVVYTGRRRLVFVDRGEGRLRPVEVTVGARTTDWISVESGLTEGDVVVSSGVFLLAAESRIRSATDYWEANDEAQ